MDLRNYLNGFFLFYTKSVPMNVPQFAEVEDIGWH